MKTEWKYMWSIVRGVRQGDIYIQQDETQWWDATFKVVLLEDGKEIPTTDTINITYGELDHCRVIAEEFVEGV